MLFFCPPLFGNDKIVIELHTCQISCVKSVTYVPNLLFLFHLYKGLNSSPHVGYRSVVLVRI